MFDYSTLLSEGLHMLELSNEKFNESQRVRIDYILYAKKSGEKFLVIKQALENASKNHPVELPGVGTFTSFQNFLEYLEKEKGIKPSTIKEHVTLAENWDVVLKLNMQDKDSVDNLGNSMRVNRTLKVIRWYDKVKDVYPPEKLTITQYWIDEEAKLEAKRLEKAERDKQDSELRKSYSELKAENELLRSQLSQVVTEQQFNTVYEHYKRVQSELEEKEVKIARLESELEEARRRLASMKPSPVVEAPRRTPVFS